MDSPEPGSPVSRSSSGSPPPEEGQFLESSVFPSNARGDAFLSGGKRRLPMGSASSANAKTRRREEGPARRTGGGAAWSSEAYPTSRNQREELVDQQLVDRIRSEWGDPFDESAVKAAS